MPTQNSMTFVMLFFFFIFVRSNLKPDTFDEEEFFYLYRKISI